MFDVTVRRIGLEGNGGSPKRRRRKVADRLTIYGLPDWVPLLPLFQMQHCVVVLVLQHKA